MGFIVTFLSVIAFWLLLSGEFKMILLVFAVLYGVIVTFFTHDLFIEKFTSKNVKQIIKFIIYVPWLIKEIVVASIQVARIVLSPKMDIDPGMIETEPELKTEMGITILANSITLTPGTVSVNFADGKLLVHSLGKESRQGIIDRVIEKKVIEIEGAGDV